MTKQKVKPRRPYDPTLRTSVIFSQPTMAKQSFKDESDINTIMRKYQSTGIIEHVQRVQGSYGDFSNVQGYQLSLNQVIAAQEAFDELPAMLRKRFGNDPAQLMTFLDDQDNLEEAIRLGLVEKPATPPEAEKPKKKPAGAAPQTPPSEGEAPAE